jgi:penicillin G amidase
MRIFRAVFLTLITILLVYVLNNKLTDLPFVGTSIPEKYAGLPPVGKFTDPFQGFWANAERKDPAKEIQLKADSLKGKVTILFDDRLVPHIFAENDEDLYFAQGYVTAMNRLWQMEFQTHYAAGRLSEIIGEKGLPIDRYQRRFGMMYGAEQSLKAMMANPESKLALESYTRGVNAYIKKLSSKDYPVEYKILDYKPEAWTTLKCALLLKYVAYDLSANGSSDMATTQALGQYGKAVADSLFPLLPHQKQPVIPTNTALDFKPLKRPAIPAKYDSVSKAIAKNLEKLQPIIFEKEKPKGSNNWAISAKKSSTGYPILANDPHLGLNLPSFWYEIQLKSPSVNVYGVSLPGSPAVIIGFNENTSWGVTSAYIDGLDFYQIKFKDSKKDEYLYDGQWKKTSKRVETIKIRGKNAIEESITYTHHGPVVQEKTDFTNNLSVPLGHAMRWIGFEENNEMLTFIHLNKAKNYQDFTEALKNYGCPALSFAYADNSKDIAMWVNGKIPLRWNGQGKYILDGSDPAHDWQGWIPSEQNPHVKNPEQGFVASANQMIADSVSYPYYLNWDYVMPERAIRINERLSQMEKINTEQLRTLQNDNLNVLARNTLPLLLKQLDSTQLTGNALKSYKLLKKWNYVYLSDWAEPTIFQNWWKYFYSMVWADDFGNSEMPSSDQTQYLMTTDTLSKWFDDRRTPQKENFKTLAQLSYKKALEEITKKHTDGIDKWQWGKDKVTYLRHLARIPGFSVIDLLTNGNSRTVNATGENHGPSWRMVVALGETPKAYGVYPGGQSGNPGSYFYDNMVGNWRLGELFELLYLKNAETKNPKILSKIMMSK